MAAQWKYKIDDTIALLQQEDAERDLNALGADGWDLVAVCDRYDSDLKMHGESSAMHATRLIFKRPT